MDWLLRPINDAKVIQIAQFLIETNASFNIMPFFGKGCKELFSSIAQLTTIVL
jgi:hypothetical protein